MGKTSSTSRMLVLLFLSVVLISLCSFSWAVDVTYDDRAIKIDGQRKLLISGSIHYPRSTPEMWPDLIAKAKDGGLNTIETYVFWNLHEPKRRQYDFTGNLNLGRFLRTVHTERLHAILRIGPYVCAEWNYGGFPVWLGSLPGIQLRTNNDAYKQEMQSFITKVVNMMKKEGMFASQGGPIILAQIENEYGNVEWAYGDDGWKYVNWCKDVALGYKLDIPWIMCQQNNAPAPMLSACNGYYCDQWHPKTNSTPKIWAENWTGWFKNWGSRDPHRTAEDVAFAVARFFQLGGSLQNYYMYHGGTNFGETAGGPYITTSYDYDAPLDEYGNLNQPKWGHLKRLHKVLRSSEKTLMYGDRMDYSYDSGGLKSVTVYSHEGHRVCFFSNAQQSRDFTLNFEGNSYTIPAWSTSILPGCYKEEYNTAKVNAQTSHMVKKDPTVYHDGVEYVDTFPYEWKWTDEKVLDVKNHGSFKGPHLVSKELLDQKTATNGTSDYLWVLTSIEYDKSDPIWGGKSKIFLHINTDGHILHAYVNGNHVGSKYAEKDKFSFLFEAQINPKFLKNGKNHISLLSATVGLANAGDHFDTRKNGINGPIKLIAKSKSGAVVKDISSHQWIYKTGLHGIGAGLHQGDTHRWHDSRRPSKKELVWYKTLFQTPLGSDPVVVDLIGLNKGVAWVNGHHIGRYWPRYHAPETGCDIHCDYRGSYGSDKCNTNCGKPTQRWYHIPRDFLKDEDNELVLFEELGGTPELVAVKTVTVGRLCLHAYNDNIIKLSCQGDRHISRITFASYGLPDGGCGHFRKTECHAKRTMEVVKENCIGKRICSLKVSEDTFGPLHCEPQAYRLAVEAVC